MEFKRLQDVLLHTVVHFLTDTLQFTKLMIYTQLLQYNTPNFMYVLKIFSGGDTLGPTRTQIH